MYQVIDDIIHVYMVLALYCNHNHHIISHIKVMTKSSFPINGYLEEYILRMNRQNHTIINIGFNIFYNIHTLY